jgi:hypothetical protein
VNGSTPAQRLPPSDTRSADGGQACPIDPTGLAPVVKEVEWCERQHPRTTFAPTDTRSAGGCQACPIDPTGLAPVVKEVEWCERQHPRTTFAALRHKVGGRLPGLPSLRDKTYSERSGTSQLSGIWASRECGFSGRGPDGRCLWPGCNVRASRHGAGDVFATASRQTPSAIGASVLNN